MKVHVVVAMLYATGLLLRTHTHTHYKTQSNPTPPHSHRANLIKISLMRKGYFAIATLVSSPGQICEGEKVRRTEIEPRN